jgi:hypothetical protein
MDSIACMHRQQLAHWPRCPLLCSAVADDVVSCFKVQAFLLALFGWIIPAYVLRRLEKQVSAAVALLLHDRCIAAAGRVTMLCMLVTCAKVLKLPPSLAHTHSCHCRCCASSWQISLMHRQASQPPPLPTGGRLLQGRQRPRELLALALLARRQAHGQVWNQSFQEHWLVWQRRRCQ